MRTNEKPCVINFGQARIGVGAYHESDVYKLSLNDLGEGPKKIGASVPREDGIPAAELRFTNRASIDVVIQKLEQLRGMMHEEPLILAA